MLLFIGILLYTTYIDASVTFDTNCSLNLTYRGFEIPDGGSALAKKGRLTLVYCQSNCTGLGITPSLEFYKNDTLISPIASSNRVYYTQTMQGRKATLHVQNTTDADEGLYSCEGWTVKGQHNIKRHFSLLFACPIDYKMCDKTRCLENSKVCNGVRDCLDETDELDCDTKALLPEACGVDMFPCDGAQCHSKTKLCDSFPDCSDGYDESATVCPCEFRCAGGTCIRGARVCDGVPDCGDAADEMGCTPNIHDLMQRLDALTQRVTDNEVKISKLSHDPVAFKAHLGVSIISAPNERVIYDEVQLNLGNAYHKHLGAFLAPVNGTYLFSVSSCSPKSHYSVLDLVNNQIPIGKVLSGSPNFNDCSSQTTITELKQGDEVYVLINEVSGVDSVYPNALNSFSGALLQMV
ncbi:complement factor I-like isoform X2 [Dreissena polymorpha]|uniref:complement factor I-like isoform X2 n=1 Tax=Dreissena polymorpha TaxID=45954 RepID=UPI002263DF56|nr:complement factor I-like isoform X2 [Dreissena polymorpha]